MMAWERDRRLKEKLGYLQELEKVKNRSQLWKMFSRISYGLKDSQLISEPENDPDEESKKEFDHEESASCEVKLTTAAF